MGAKSLNKVILIGHVGKKPDIVRVGENKKASFTLATNEIYTDKDGQEVKITDWHNIVVWRKLADIVEQFVDKGSLLYVEGKLRTRQYEDTKNQNIKRYITEVICDNLIMLDSRREEYKEKPDEVSSTSDYDGESFNEDVENINTGEDDLPF